MKRNGELLSTLINEILDLSKVEAGKLEVEKSGCFVAGNCWRHDNPLNLLAVEKGVDLSINVHPSTPNLVRTDPLRLRHFY